MASHFKESRGRSTVATVAMALVVVIALGAFAEVFGFGSQVDSGSGKDAATSEPVLDDAVKAGDDQSPDVEGGLPFQVQGVPSAATVLEASDCDEKADLTQLWSFGGDYSVIGSFPLGSGSVFGSMTDDPNDVEGYVAAVLGEDSSKALEDRQTTEQVFEPQDGTGTPDLMVWRSSELSNLPVTGVDNWRVQAWSSKLGHAIVLGTAESLNGTNETPMLDGEIVPTANDKRAFFASFMKSEESWKPAVVSWEADSQMGQTTVVGEGSYPSATSDGCIWATDPDYESSGTFYESLSNWNGESSSGVFSITSSEGVWGISGTWASTDYRVVGFSSDDASRGSYLGIWNADFSDCLGWVHVLSPRAVGSLNNSYFVWGAGSEADNAEMYALNLDSMSLSVLGTCPGYSRPTIAPDDNTVLVPIANGMSAVSFNVSSLE